MLDDVLSLFRRSPSPVRRRRPAAPVAAVADNRWRINLASLGGMIGFGRPDRIPRTGPAMQPRRQHQEPDDWEP
ncbi:MAG: hypothetical protein WCG92_11260, partial [Hyphomicrobiales bacterium]